MSLLNLWIEPARALVAVDTAGGEVVEGEPSVAEWSKLLALPHLNALLAARGERVTFFNVFAQCYLGFPGADFDTLIDAMPTLIQSAFDCLSSDPRSANLLDKLTVELALIGWSPRRAAMVAMHYVCRVEDKSIAMSEVAQCRIAPASKSEVEPLDTDEAMTRLARDQVSQVRRTMPGEVIGGRLLVAEVRHGSIHIREACALG